MIAVCAVQDNNYAVMASRILMRFGHEVFPTDSMEGILRIFEENDVDIVLCDLDLGGQDLTDLPEKFPKPAWIAHMTDLQGRAAAGTVMTRFQFDDVLPPQPSPSNLYVALWRVQHLTAKNPLFDSNGMTAYFQSLNQTFHALAKEQEFPAPEGSDCIASLNDLYFRKVFHGTFAHSHFGAVFYDILSERRTGHLHLWRPGLHWIVSFLDGCPLDIDMGYSRKMLDILAMPPKQRHPLMNAGSVDLMRPRHERILALDAPYASMLKWLTDSIIEIFSWPQADFSWRQGEVKSPQPYHPRLSPSECMKWIVTGVKDWMSAADILDVTRSCMPYFLKIREENHPDLESFSDSDARAVVEKLKIGDTLTEMLSESDNHRLVHAIVYLLLMMGHLDLVS